MAEHRYRIVFLAKMPTEAEFLEAVQKDLRPCLAAADELGAPDSPSRSVVLTTCRDRAHYREESGLSQSGIVKRMTKWETKKDIYCFICPMYTGDFVGLMRLKARLDHYAANVATRTDTGLPPGC